MTLRQTAEAPPLSAGFIIISSSIHKDEIAKRSFFETFEKCKGLGTKYGSISRRVCSVILSNFLHCPGLGVHQECPV